MEKVIRFTAPLYISQSVRLEKGKMKWRFVGWRIPHHFWRWLKSLFVESYWVGKTEKIREGYFGIGADGNLERLVEPTIDLGDELEKLIGLSIETIED